MAQAQQQIPREDIQLIQKLKAECQALDQKMAELEAERDEHNLVIKALQGLEPERNCFRLVGGVLVQRTVGEVLPVVTSNSTNLTDLIKQLETTLTQKNQQLGTLAKKYGLTPQEQKAAPAEGEKKPVKKEGQGGILA